MSTKPLVTAALATAGVRMPGGLALTAAWANSTTPSPQVVIPASQQSRGSDDPATHDAGDDKGGATATSDDPATHDAGDDKGGATASPTDPATHDTTDDSSGSGSGSGGSGSGGSGGSGSDDSTSGGHGSDG
jgi:hypothetical protein